ncbi:hypothetical protein P3W85_09055 [Cupriavidus basilensis]|uniref:Uncharacterized protein n=1 Tax=Cupriavidus basilensis TaxID=68895 RepID=A0ABT6AMV3_9BURK|nr:hypothetical protein [Cupriavidus basilensis]MDF3833096.1 hypothetical protein [Cupriavidus basilensis]
MDRAGASILNSEAMRAASAGIVAPALPFKTRQPVFVPAFPEPVRKDACAPKVYRAQSRLRRGRACSRRAVTDFRTSGSASQRTATRQRMNEMMERGRCKSML